MNIRLLALVLIAVAGGCQPAARSNKPLGGDSTGGSAPSNATSIADYQHDAVALSQLRERAFEEIGRELTSDWAEARANAVEALLASPQRLAAAVRDGLLDSNVGVRTVSAMAAGKARLRSLSDRLRPLVYDPSPYVQAAAVFALVRSGSSTDPSPLAAILKDPSARVRAHAAFILGELGNRTAVPLLAEAAREAVPGATPNEERALRLQVAEAMYKLGETKSVHEIRAALYPSKPEDLEVAALAAQMLGELRDRESITQLVFLTTKPDAQGALMPAEVRLAAAMSLGKLGLQQGAFVAQEFAGNSNPALRAQAASVYGQSRLRANLAPLSNLLSDTHPLVRLAAAAAVLRITEAGVSDAGGP
ncbi:MAG: HEAT repeat domain-containing protein [Phycisphaerae bacterium]|nr:HEAT repeat domain-containing protein [Phycisphaerae bacterium]